MPPDFGGREAILETSAKLFSQQGYKEVSIRDIAQACGMTNAALYYHFKNKEDLFLAMLQRDHEKALRLLEEAADGPGDLRADLSQLVAAYIKVTCEQRQTFQTLWRDLKQMEDARARKLFGDMRADLLRPLEARLAAAQTDGELRAGDVKFYARLLHGLIISLAHQGPPGRASRVPGSEIETVIEIFLNGTRRQDKSFRKG
jgi:AcrR family transcriptional regulator